MCNVDPNTTLSLVRLHQADLTASFSRRRRNFRHDPSLPTHDFSVRGRTDGPGSASAPPGGPREPDAAGSVTGARTGARQWRAPVLRHVGRGTSPLRCASAAASVRLATPSLAMMCETWTLAVFGDM